MVAKVNNVFGMLPAVFGLPMGKNIVVKKNSNNVRKKYRAM